MKYHFPFAALFAGVLLLPFLACHTAQTTATTPTGSSKAVFTANPKPIPHQDVKTLEIGASAPDFQLPGADNKFYSLSDFKAAKALVIVFTCNHCPTAQAYEARINTLAVDYKSKNVAVIAISPNSPVGLLYEELGYSDLGDTYADMQTRAKLHKLEFPYLYDGDTESASLRYGPTSTPHAFVFDGERKLRYVGRLDKVEKPGTANSEDVRAAVEAILAGKTIAEPVTKTFGCSVKWGWKVELKEKTDQEWAEKPVKISKIAVKGVQTVLKNEGSGKLRLINVWASWCGPCMLEYPEFIVVQRMFGARDFEFVSISADKVEQEAKALKVLTEKQSAVTNYLFSGADTYALIEAVDKNWNGALPYTVLVEPGGKIVWQHQGEVDFAALKRTIVEHKMMGRYY